VVLVILVFWLVMVGWLYQRDLRPRLRSDEPALFLFDLSEEARIELTDRLPRVPLGAPPTENEQGRNQVQARPILWKVRRNDKDVRDKVETRVVYQQKDHTLVLIGDFKQFIPDQPGTDPILQIESTYHVSWGGALLDMAADVWVRELDEADRHKIAQLDTTIYNNQIFPHWQIRTARGDQRMVQEPVPLSKRGTAMCLTQPFTRITGLVVGQRWQVPMLNPLDVGRTRQPGPWLSLEAEVGEQRLTKPHRPDTLCHVITCSQAGEPFVRIWVRKSDSLVLRQEVLLPGDTMLFERDP
jgi:hypothetical protein